MILLNYNYSWQNLKTQYMLVFLAKKMTTRIVGFVLFMKK